MARLQPRVACTVKAIEERDDVRQPSFNIAKIDFGGGLDIGHRASGTFISYG